MQYLIRQALLLAFFDFTNPQELRIILFHDALKQAFGKMTLSGDDSLTVRAEIKALCTAGYLEPVTGFDEWYKLSKETRLQLTAAEGKLNRSELKNDPRIFGPGALQ